MAWAFNSLTTPVTNTATLITFNMVDALGAAVTSPGTMQVRIVGTGMTYNSTTGVMTGTVTSVQLFNNTTGVALQTLTIDSARAATVADDVTAFLSRAITFQSQLTAWTAPTFNNYGTASELNSLGTELQIPLLNGTTVVGFLRITGDNLYANKPEANSIVYTVELLTAAGASYVPPRIADYTGPAYSSAGTEMMLDEIVYGGRGNWELLWGVFASGNDSLTVNAANTFVLEAGIGNDTITGTAGIDTVDFKYATGGVTVDLAASTNQVEFMDEVTSVTYRQQLIGIENIFGSRYADNIRGDSGNNLLWGGDDLEADTLAGGEGNDTYIINDLIDRVNDSGGTDTIRSTINIDLNSFLTVENLEMVGTQINGSGNALNNTITGNAQANVINGRAGADTMIGNAGNDTYFVDNAGDVIIENAGGGTDTVFASTSFALAAGADVEILRTTSDTGTTAINLTGSSIINTITGNNGANRLDGGADSVTDVLNGLLGNDTYVLGAGNDTVNDTGGIDTIESSITRSLMSYATIENLTLTGSASINATGNASNNLLIGNSGNNVITGGAGNDTMVGGTGNDTFVFEANGADIITDFGARYFTVSMNGASVVAPTASTATATGSAVMNLSSTRVQLDLVSSGLNWNSSSTAGNKVTQFGYYQGAAGANGTMTHDILAGTSPFKTINATTNTVRSIWTTANGLTSALAGNIATGGHYLEIDTTDFASPAAIRGQLLANGTSADVISVAGLNITDFATIQELAYDSGSSVIIRRNSNGTAHTLTLQNTREADLVTGHFAYSAVNAVDNLTGTANADDMFGGLGNDILNGGAGSDRLFGEAGNDLLNGGTGNDRMFGGLGNDTYVVDSLADFINDTGGTDLIQTSVNYSLVNLAAIENLAASNAAATTNLTLWGNASANQITGNAGNNSIDGRAGNDTMTGLGGNDTYFVDAAGDVIVDSAGIDTVRASVSYTLGAGVAVEVLTAASASLAINLTGNELAQRVIGSNAVNVINGGAGNDTLTGYGGNDFFVFNTALNSSTNVDTITDFNPIADTIRLENTGAGLFNALGLGTLSASRFVVGTAALDTADRIIYNKATGALFYDADGSGAGAAIQFAVIQNKAALTAADFVVI